jgi:hypothetical protein
MAGRVEEEYADVLQNIEAAIVAAFRNNSKFVDRDVLAAVEALIKNYKRSVLGRGLPSPVPPGRAGSVYKQCLRICEWRLGKQPLNDGKPLKSDPKAGELSVDEIILCLKRLRKSIRLWHAHAGPQGYLKYVHQFLPDS